MPLFFRLIIIFFSTLVLTVSCGESNNQKEPDDLTTNIEEKILVYSDDFESNGNLDFLSENTEDFNLSIDNTRSFSGNHSLKIINTTGCLAVFLLSDIPVSDNQSYEISFAVLRTGSIYDLSECDTSGYPSFSKLGLEKDQRKSKAGVAIPLTDVIIYQAAGEIDYIEDPWGIWIDVNQDNQSIVKTSGTVIDSVFWATVTVLITTKDESPLSVSLKTNYEILWIDDVIIKQVNNTE